MTSRRLRSAALISVNRTNPVFFLTVLLYGTAIWQFFQVFFMMPVSPLMASILGFLLCGLQALAASAIWDLSRRGAILAVVVLAFRFAALGLQSFVAVFVGADWLTLADMASSFVVVVLIVALLRLSWDKMKR